MDIDWSAVIVGLMALGGTLGGSYFSNNKASALIAYRLQELEEKVHKHNNLVERMTIVERDLKTAFYRIEEVKNDVDKIESEKH